MLEDALPDPKPAWILSAVSTKSKLQELEGEWEIFPLRLHLLTHKWEVRDVPDNDKPQFWIVKCADGNRSFCLFSTIVESRFEVVISQAAYKCNKYTVLLAVSFLILQIMLTIPV